MRAVSDLYGEMWKAIIRPPRDFYTVDQLGPTAFRVKGTTVRRNDFTLRSKRGLLLQCSHFEFVSHKDPRILDPTPRPCVVYMHGNCSSRLEAVHCGAAATVLPQKMSLFCFDFGGSGLSDGEYVSLGFFERDDLRTVVEYLRSNERVSAVALWGRSMGAVTACLFAKEDPTIACMVVDSPFSSLKKLAEELAADYVGFKLPRFIFRPALDMIRNTVLQKADFDLDELNVKPYCEEAFIPALFIAAKSDTFIKPQHTIDLHDNLILIDGGHNDSRPESLNDNISIFLTRTFALLPSSETGTNGIRRVWDGIAVHLAQREQRRRRKICGEPEPEFDLLLEGTSIEEQQFILQSIRNEQLAQETVLTQEGVLPQEGVSPQEGVLPQDAAPTREVVLTKEAISSRSENLHIRDTDKRSENTFESATAASKGIQRAATVPVSAVADSTSAGTFSATLSNLWRRLSLDSYHSDSAIDNHTVSRCGRRKTEEDSDPFTDVKNTESRQNNCVDDGTFVYPSLDATTTTVMISAESAPAGPVVGSAATTTINDTTTDDGATVVANGDLPFATTIPAKMNVSTKKEETKALTNPAHFMGPHRLM